VEWCGHKCEGLALKNLEYQEKQSSIYGGFKKKMGFPPNQPFVHRVFHYLNHPFWETPVFLETPKNNP